MKVVVLNFSGNVGKTTVAKHLFLSHMPADTKFIPVETVNDVFDDDVKIRASRFDEIINMALTLDNAVFDVGSSNAEEFLEKAAQRPGCAELFDLFALPVTSGIKQQTDTVETVAELASMGIPPSNILVIPNRFDGKTPLEVAFSGIYNAFKSGLFTFSPEIVVKNNDIFDMLRSHPWMGDDIRALSQRNHSELAANIKKMDVAEKNRAMVMYSAILLSRTVVKEMDAVWSKVVDTIDLR